MNIINNINSNRKKATTVNIIENIIPDTSSEIQVCTNCRCELDETQTDFYDQHLWCPYCISEYNAHRYATNPALRQTIKQRTRHTRQRYVRRTTGTDTVTGDWSPEEDDTLTRLYPTTTAVDIAVTLRRTYWDVTRRVLALELRKNTQRAGKRPGATSAATPVTRFIEWTDADDLILRRHAGVVSVRGLATALRRSEDDVASRLNQLNLAA